MNERNVGVDECTDGGEVTKETGQVVGGGGWTGAGAFGWTSKGGH